MFIRTFFLIAAVSIFLVADPSDAAEPAAITIKLVNGDPVTGQFKVQSKGAFLHTDSGGKLYRWEQLNPASLPDSWRAAVRKRALAYFKTGKQLLEEEMYPTSETLFARGYALRYYLTSEDFQTWDPRHLKRYAYGLIQHEGEWVSYQSLMANKGMVWLDGEWVEKEQAQELQAFRQAFAKVRQAQSQEAALIALRQVVLRYPESAYVQDAEKVINHLTQQIAKAKEPKAVNSELDEEDDRQGMVIGWDSPREKKDRNGNGYDDEFEVDWDDYTVRRPSSYYPPKIIRDKNGRVTTVIPPTPRYGYGNHYRYSNRSSVRLGGSTTITID